MNLPPLLWLSGAFMLGLPVGFALPLPLAVWVGTGGLLLAASFVEQSWNGAIFLRFRTILGHVPACLILTLLCFGAARSSAARPAADGGNFTRFTGTPVRLVGWVSAPPEPRLAGGDIPVQVEAQTLVRLKENNPAGSAETVRGRVLVRLPAGTIHYGDGLQIDGTLAEPPAGEGFSYRDYLERQGISYQISRVQSVRQIESARAGSPVLGWLYRQREAAYAVINRIFPQPEAALLNGILLGLDRDLPPTLAEDYKITGTAHIIAISGFNISILAALFFSLFRLLFSRWGALAGAILATWGYAFMVGAEPPVIRAAVMGAMFLIGREIGRGASGLTMLAFSAAAMCLGNPHLPWDPSFQLSFMATLGLILYAGPLQRGFRSLLEKKLDPGRASRIAAPVGEYVLVTLAAQITTLPVMMVHFQRLSLVALLSNPLVLPPQPHVMIISGLAVLAGRLWLPLGQAVGALAWPLAAYTNRMVILLARLPGASIDLAGAGLGFAAVYYAALFSLPLLKKQWPRLRSALTPAAGFTALGLAAALVWTLAAARPDGRLHIDILNLESDATVIVRFPGRQSLLIGAAQPAVVQPVFDRLCGPEPCQPDALILPGAIHTDSAALLSILEKYEGMSVYASDAAWEAPAGRRLEMDLVEGGVITAGLPAGTVWSAGPARLEVLAVKDDSAALLVEYDQLRVLLPGRVPPTALRAKQSRITGVSLLVLEDAKIASQWKGWEEHQRVVLTAAKSQVDTGALALLPGWRLSLTSNGQQMWLESGNIE